MSVFPHRPSNGQFEPDSIRPHFRSTGPESRGTFGIFGRSTEPSTDSAG